MMPTRKASKVPLAERPLRVEVDIDILLLDDLVYSSIPGTTRNEKIINAIKRGLEIEAESRKNRGEG